MEEEACSGMKGIGKLCTGKLYARFDEGGLALPVLYPSVAPLRNDGFQRMSPHRRELIKSRRTRYLGSTMAKPKRWFGLYVHLAIRLKSLHEIHYKITFYPDGNMMKKTFKLTHAKLEIPRVVEAIKHEVKKYIKRERNKALPDGADFWDFDCRFGADEATSEVIHMSAINEHISQAELDQRDSFYLEIMAKPAQRNKKPIE